MNRRGAGVALLWGALVAGPLGGCKRTPAALGAPEDGGIAVPRPSGLLQVPAGWSVATGGDGVLRVADSPGHTVLRAEMRSGMGMPTPESLRSGFTEGLRRWRVRRAQSVEEPGFIAVRLLVVEPGDGGGVEQEVFLSATELGTDTLLCASVRGASPATLELVEQVCRGAGQRRDGG